MINRFWCGTNSSKEAWSKEK